MDFGIIIRKMFILIIINIIINIIPRVDSSIVTFRGSGNDDILGTFLNVDIAGINQTGYQQISGKLGIAEFLIPLSDPSVEYDDNNNLRCRINPSSYYNTEVL